MILSDRDIKQHIRDGKITIDQLHRNARTVKDRAKRIVGLKTALREIGSLQGKLNLSESMRETQRQRLFLQ